MFQTKINSDYKAKRNLPDEEKNSSSAIDKNMIKSKTKESQIKIKVGQAKMQ